MTLINLFEKNFKPYDVTPMIGLSKKYIIKNGYSESDIKSLISEGKIERFGLSGYRMTQSYIRKFAGNSYKYIPSFVE